MPYARRRRARFSRYRRSSRRTRRPVARRSRRTRRTGRANGASNLRGRRTRLVNLGLNVPQRVVNKLKWSNVLTLTSASDGFFSGVYVANSVYDPDYALGGSAASWFDTMTNLYLAYRVNASKITAKIIFPSSNTTPTLGGIMFTPGSSNIMAAYNANKVNSGWSTPPRILNGYASGKPTILKSYATMKRAFTDNKIEYEADNTYWGSPSSNPTTLGLWQLWLQQMGASSIVTVMVNVQITYYVEWKDRLFYST